MTDAATEPLIGVINAGSSSLKFSFYEGEKRLLTGQVDGIGVRPLASATGPDGEAIAPPDLGATPPSTPSEVLPAVKTKIVIDDELNQVLPLLPLTETGTGSTP